MTDTEACFRFVGQISVMVVCLGYLGPFGDLRACTLPWTLPLFITPSASHTLLAGSVGVRDPSLRLVLLGNTAAPYSLGLPGVWSLWGTESESAVASFTVPVSGLISWDSKHSGNTLPVEGGGFLFVLNSFF